METLIINDRWKIYRINNGGKPVTEWPTDAELAEKWEKVD